MTATAQELRELVAQHPRLREELLPAEIEEATPEEKVRKYYDALNDAITFEQTDPLRYGFEPAAWKELDDAIADFRARHPIGVILVVLLGGNRASKTEWKSKRLVENMFTRPSYKAWACHSTQESSREAQQKKIYRYLPPEYRPDSGRYREGKNAKIVYTPWGGFTMDVFALPSNVKGISECRFKFYGMNPRSLEGAEIDEGWMDEEAPVQWLDALIGRAVSCNGIIFLTFTAKNGYTEMVRSILEGAKTVKEIEAELLPIQKRQESGSQEARKGEAGKQEIRNGEEDLSGGVESRHANHEVKTPNGREDSAQTNNQVNRRPASCDSESSDSPAQNFPWGDKEPSRSTSTSRSTTAAELPRYELVPRIQENENVVIRASDAEAGDITLRTKALIFYFNTGDNPYGNPAAMKATLAGASRDRIKMQYYGIPTKGAAVNQFNFVDEAHKIPQRQYLALVTKLAGKGARYHLVDPCSGRNWFMLWLWFWAPKKAIVYREWPSYGGRWAYVEGIGDPGPWSVPGSRTIGGKPALDGVPGPAQTPFRFGLERYREEILKAESTYAKATADSSSPAFGGTGEEVIYQRLIDSRYANAAKTEREGSTTLIEQLADIDLDFVAMTGEKKILSGEADGSIELINAALAYDEATPAGEFSKSLGRINEPNLLVTDQCPNTINSLRNWTGRDGGHGACKDPIDCLRGAFLSELDYVDEENMRVKVHSHFQRK